MMKYKLQKQYDGLQVQKNNIHVFKGLKITQICLDYKWYLQ